MKATIPVLLLTAFAVGCESTLDIQENKEPTTMTATDPIQFVTVESATEDFTKWNLYQRGPEWLESNLSETERKLPEAEKKKVEYRLNFDVRFSFEWISSEEFAPFKEFASQDWEANCSAYSNRLVELARNKSLDSTTLKKLLDGIRERNNPAMALIPVKAVSVKFEGKPHWMIFAVWGVKNAGKTNHIKAWLFDANTCEQIGFSSCM